MKTTKFGHSCLLIEEGGVKILLDPGSYSEIPDQVSPIDFLLLTHKHHDHVNKEKIHRLLELNPKLEILTNKDTAIALEEMGFKAVVVAAGDQEDLDGVKLEVFGQGHAETYPGRKIDGNTGFLLAGRLYHPGDSLTIPSKPVEILGLPVCAPWLRLADAVNFAKEIKPKVAIPIHDGHLKITGAFYGLPQEILTPLGVQFLPLELGKPTEL